MLLCEISASGRLTTLRVGLLLMSIEVELRNDLSDCKQPS